MVVVRSGTGLVVVRAYWDGVRSGLSNVDAAAAAGTSPRTGARIFRDAGGVNPLTKPAPVGVRYLSFDEREQILAHHSAGLGVRAIGRVMGRAASTISRELARGHTKAGYRPSRAQQVADCSRRSPRAAKLAVHARLRDEVQRRLEQRLSPQQIAGRLITDFPDDLEMRVSHETIYQALYVQARGGLKKELVKHLRTGRSLRKPHRVDGRRFSGPVANMVMISQRPPEVEDRAVPGHWEGDLILGSVASGSAIGTLVERATGFLMLLHLPNGHSALEVQEAMIAKMSELPEHLKRTLTWDQGSEMANHLHIAQATGLEIYFCDPHSPWQRGSNENTNGLLRQYFPKGTDLSFHGAGILDNVAAEMNNRPRKRHQWATPAEVLTRLLLEQDNNDDDVASQP